MCRRGAAPSEDAGAGVQGSLRSISCPGSVYVALLALFFFKVYFLAVPHSMWDLHSLTRDQPLTPCSGSKEPFFFFHLTIYFWLHWVLITTCGLSLAAESGGCSPMQLLGLLFLGPWALGHSGSGRCGSRAPGLRLNSRGAQA